MLEMSLLATGIHWNSRGAFCQDVPRRTSRAAGRLPRVTMEVEALVAQLLPTEDDCRLLLKTWVDLRSDVSRWQYKICVTTGKILATSADVTLNSKRWLARESKNDQKWN